MLAGHSARVQPGNLTGTFHSWRAVWWRCWKRFGLHKRRMRSQVTKNSTEEGQRSAKLHQPCWDEWWCLVADNTNEASAVPQLGWRRKEVEARWKEPHARLEVLQVCHGWPFYFGWSPDALCFGKGESNCVWEGTEITSKTFDNQRSAEAWEWSHPWQSSARPVHSGVLPFCTIC